MIFMEFQEVLFLYVGEEGFDIRTLSFEGGTISEAGLGGVVVHGGRIINLFNKRSWNLM